MCAQLACWRAHPVGISSVQCAEVQGVLGGNLLLVASQDCTVSLWNLRGGLVGVLGKHTWTLPDATTWQDAKVLPNLTSHIIWRCVSSCFISCICLKAWSLVLGVVQCFHAVRLNASKACALHQSLCLLAITHVLISALVNSPALNNFDIEVYMPKTEKSV